MLFWGARLDETPGDVFAFVSFHRHSGSFAPVILAVSMFSVSL
jgi:hypothetical protein